MVLIAVIVVLGGAFSYYYVSSSGTISSQSSQLSANAAQIASDSAKITGLTSTVASLQQTLNAANARLSSLTAGYAKANSTIDALNAQVTSISAEIASDTAQITSLQQEVSSLQAIATLAQFTVLVSSQQVFTNASGIALLDNFTANYAGYVTVTASASSDPANVGAFTDQTFSAAINSPDFTGIAIPAGGFYFPFNSVPSTIVFPVLPGSVAVYLVTSDATAQSATVTVTYYY